jgi:hypothetical protein
MSTTTRPPHGPGARTGIALWANGQTALRSIGPDVMEEVHNRGCDITGMRMGFVDEPLPGDAPKAEPRSGVSRE